MEEQNILVPAAISILAATILTWAWTRDYSPDQNFRSPTDDGGPQEEETDLLLFQIRPFIHH